MVENLQQSVIVLVIVVVTVMIWLGYGLASWRARRFGWRPHKQARGVGLFNVLILLPFVFALGWRAMRQSFFVGRWAFLALALLASLLDLLWLAYFLALDRLWHHSFPRRADYLVVLSCYIGKQRLSPFLQGRCEVAVRLFQHVPTAKLVLCGGQGSDEAMTEAKAMFGYLQSRGIPPAKMLLEQRSTSTAENLAFARHLIDTDWRGGRPARWVIISSAYHVPRALLLAHRMGVCATGIGHQLPLACLPDEICREYGAILKMSPAWVIGMVLISIIGSWLILI